MPKGGATSQDGGDFTEDERLRKVERLRQRAEFLHAQRRGRRRSGPRLVVYATENGRGWNRLGLTTSRKVGNAARRNRWRRLLREAFRRNKASLDQGFDLVVIVKAGERPPSYEEARDEFLEFARRAASAARKEPKS